MATQVKIKRGTTNANAPTGLTAGEMAINLVDKKLYVGGTAGTNAIFLDSTAVAGLSTVNTFTAANTFSAGITVSGILNAVNINTTGYVSINNGPATLATTTVGTANVFNTVATSLGIGGAATAITMGAPGGTINLRNPTIQVGNTVATITTASGTANTLTVSPFGNFVVSPTSTVNVGGTRPSLTVTNTDQGVGTVSVSGGNLYLGVGSLFDGDFTYNNAPVNIVFEGASADANETTLTIAEPTADRTITLPDASGTVALTATSVASFNGFTGGITFAAGTGITFTASAGTITLSTTGGGGGATGATGATGSQGIQGITGPVGDYVISFNGLTGDVTGITAGGINTFTALQTFSAGISASGATFSAGTTAIAPIRLQSGTNLTTPTSGAVEFDGKVFYSTVATGRGFVPSVQIIIPSEDFTLVNDLSLQDIFASSQNLVTLQANTTYMFESMIIEQNSAATATSHYTIFALSLDGGATASSFIVSSMGFNTTVFGAAVTAQTTVCTDDPSATGWVATTTTNAAFRCIKFEGTIRVTDGGTMTPQLVFSAAPGNTTKIKVGSYFKIYAIGSDTIQTIGAIS